MIRDVLWFLTVLAKVIDLRPIGDVLYSCATIVEPSAANVTTKPLVFLAPTTNWTSPPFAYSADCIFIFVAGVVFSYLGAELPGRVFGRGLLSPPPGSFSGRGTDSQIPSPPFYGLQDLPIFRKVPIPVPLCKVEQ